MLVRYVKNEIIRTFRQYSFWVAMIIFLGVLIRGIIANVNLEVEVSMYEIISCFEALSGYSPFAAIFPAMGYGMVYCEEQKSRYIRMVIHRTGVVRFGIARFIATGVQGGIIVGLPYLLVCTFAYMKGTHGIDENSFLCETIDDYFVSEYGDLSIVFVKTLLAFIFGMTWAIVGLALSFWFCNKYISVFGPFIIYDLLWVVLYNKPEINPIFLIRGNLAGYGNSVFMELVLLVIAVVTAVGGLIWRVRSEKI